MALGDLPGARRAYEESYTTFRDNSERSKSAYPLVGRAMVLTAQGEFASAWKQFEEGIALCKESGEKHEMAMAFAGLGDLLFQQADLDGARQNYQAALSTRNELGEKEASAESLLQLATLALDQGHPAEAEGNARKALEEFQAEKMTAQQVWAYSVLARSYLAHGKINDAQRAITLATPILQRTQHREAHLDFQIAAAQVQASSGKSTDVEAALRALEAAIKDAQKAGLLRLAYEGALAWSNVQIKSGNAAEGRARLASLQKEAVAKNYLLVARKATNTL
jgi:tetratricopeptide (TPR) repeat protein